MVRKSFAFILLLALTAVISIAQEAPEAKKSKESKEKDKAYKKLNNSLLRSYAISSSGFGRSYLGIHMQEVTKENFSKFGLSEVRGVAVKKVVEDSPAAKAGLQDGDVLAGFNGESVTSVRKLRRLISEVAPDHTTRVTVLRKGSEQNLSVKMGARKGVVFSSGRNRIYSLPNVVIPELPEVPLAPKLPRVRVAPESGTSFLRMSGRTIGVGVTPLTKQLGDFFGVSGGKGLLINRVTKDSPAAKAGLKAGDIILEIEGKEVSRTFDVMRALGEKKEGDVTLKVLRNKRTRTITVTPEKSKNGARYFFDGFNVETNDVNDNN